MTQLRGGLPPSYTAGTDEQSRRWREQYVAAFLERDIPQSMASAMKGLDLARLWVYGDYKKRARP